MGGGKQLPKNDAMMLPIPFARRDGFVSYLSPAASALSRFCKEPTTLKSPIGIITDISRQTYSLLIRLKTLPITGIGGCIAADIPLLQSGSKYPLMPERFSAHAIAVPTPIAKRPPGIPPGRRTWDI